MRTISLRSAQAKEKSEKDAEKERKKKEKADKKGNKKRRPNKVVGADAELSLPENRRKVRMAIKNRTLGNIDESEIDPMEITDRLDMLGHRSDIILRSAQRLLDQIIVMEEESGGGDGDDGEIKIKKPPYGVTGEMLGLYGVEEAVVAEDQNVTDLEIKEKGFVVLQTNAKLEESLGDLKNGGDKKNPTKETIADMNATLAAGFRAGSPPQAGL